MTYDLFENKKVMTSACGNPRHYYRAMDVVGRVLTDFCTVY